VVRALRDASNAAIAARDAGRTVSLMTPDVRVAVAGGPVLQGVDANRAAFAGQMADPAFRGYVRTPEAITVRDDGTRAEERGAWVGRWQTRAGPLVQRGAYEAVWVLTPLGWRIAAETFRPEGG
jgi:ketosteroid isomerase-like protein